MKSRPHRQARSGGRDAGAAPPPFEPPGGALTPAAVQRRLGSAVFGHRIFYYPTIGSTNDRALELAGAGESEGALVLAEEQTAGRGRRTRTWISPPGLGIYASLVLRPSQPAGRAPIFTLMAAVSVAANLRETWGLEACIKWPNDVLIGGRKIAGVLGEVRGSDPEIREMVIGIGINVNQIEGDLEPSLRGKATSVRMEVGAAAGRAGILAAVLEGFERRYARTLREGPTTLLREWESLSALPIGSLLEVTVPAGRLSGMFTGLDEDGALVLSGAAGETIRVPFGEIVEPLRT